MATDALTAFLQSDFQHAEHALIALSSANPSDLHNVDKLTEDPRIKHNALVSRFYARKTQAQLDDLVRFVAGFLPEHQAPSSVADFFATTALDSSALKFLHSHVGPVSLYNIAVIAYHTANNQAAAAVGTLLYNNVEAMDDWLALKTCFLLIDVHLRQADVSSANTVAAYAEKLIPNFAKDVSNHSDHQNGSTHPSDFQTLTPNWSGRATSILEAPASYEDAKFCMHIYNARLSAISEGTRNIRKEAKSAVLAASDADSRPTAAALLVKARVEQSHAKGLRILASIGNQSPSHIMRKVRPLALNSLGVLHHRLGRHALAAGYFEHARRAFIQLFEEKSESDKKEDSDAAPVNLAILNSVKDSHVSYNLALQYMKLSDYSRALKLFATCARKDTTLAADSALLWIRIAECCIGVETTGTEPKQFLSIEGHGRGRRMIIRSENRTESLSMEYAATCARAAIAILDRQKGVSEYQTPVGSPQKSKKYSPFTGSNVKQEKSEGIVASRPPLQTDDTELRGAALALMAYASLCFDPLATIEACDDLLKLYTGMENERTILSRLYGAEALCILGRPEEAANRLVPLLALSASTDNNFREAAYINIALAHISNGDLVTASRAAKVALKVTASNQSRHRNLCKEASFVASYIFLRSGEVEAARRVLRSLSAQE